MAMAPVKFTKPPDLSGRTPIYRLSKTVPSPAPAPQPSASPQFVNKGSHPHTSHYQPPYPPHPPPFNPPHTASPASQPGPQPQSTPQDNKENAFAHTPQSLDSPAQGSPPMTKRRGRKLQENEILILVNCCLEYQSLYHDNPQRFWYCVATSLKRQIKRNFSSHSCRQIVEELVVERRERRRDVAAGKVKEQPLTELVLATDKWISFMDTAPGGNIASPAPLMKRAAPDIADDSNAKRPKPHEPPPSVPPPAASQPQPLSQPPSQPPSQPLPLSMPPVAQPMPPYAPYPNAGLTVPSGPTMAAEFQTLKLDIRSLRMDVQGLRREMAEVRQELNTKLDLILQALQQAKATTEAKET